MNSKRFLCVYCGSRLGTNPRYEQLAREFGLEMVARGWGLVYGGGHVGLMGVLADAVLKGGGEVIGVIPQSLVDLERAHPKLTELHITQSMHERKALMEKKSDAFVALPGGFGTMDELCEMVTWAQLELHQKPVAIFEMENYYQGFFRFLDRMVQDGFLPQAQRELLFQSSSMKEIFDYLGSRNLKKS